MNDTSYHKRKNRESYYRHRESRLKRYREYDIAVNLMKKYGITPKQWEEMYSCQKGRCAICGKHQSQEKRRLSVDHDHVTGEVRGLLCMNCNVKLGWLENNKDSVKVYLGDI